VGQCGFACLPGFFDCNHDPSDGCEVNLQNDNENCGACGTSCDATHDQCSAGACSPLLCDFGYADCNSPAPDGCETNTQSDPNNCNGCGLACPVNNNAPVCIAGACGLGACTTGYTDCDHIAATGCEIHTAADLSNCGACGNSCTAPGGGGTEACTNGLCVGSCSSGTLCGASVNNTGGGACVNTNTDKNNCGACGNVCPAPANSVATCSAHVCSFVCLPGFVKQGNQCLHLTN
jgi:hypothetical protein